MLVPISWLKEFLATDATTETIAHTLTIAGIEVDAIHSYGAYHSSVVTAEVVSHECTDEKLGLHKFTVSTGARAFTVASRADNAGDLKVGDKLALALPGSHLIQATQEIFATFTVEAQEIYGISAQGLLCTECELGVSAKTSLMILGSEAKLGEPVLNALTPSENWEGDEVLELAILANIARCQSVLGVARELAAILRLATPVAPAFTSLESTPNVLSPRITEKAVCKRLSLAKINGVTVQSSPRWLQRRLVLCGVKLINNLVDLTNYVMLELGQPMHAYDAKRLSALNLTAGLSSNTSRLQTLADQDEQTELHADYPVIKSDESVVAIAGVIGGMQSSVEDSTTDILLEAANFDFITIRKTQSALKLITEASSRFSRGVDPMLTLLAIGRYLTLLQESCPQASLEGIGDDKEFDESAFTVSVSTEAINAALGVSLQTDAVVELLQAVELQVTAADDVIHVEVDSSRNDIEGKHDIIEEVARLYGFDEIPETMPVQPIPPRVNEDRYRFREAVRDTLVQLGLQDTLSYTMTSESVEQALYAAEETTPRQAYTRLMNPISDEKAVLRRSLLPALLQHAAENSRYQKSCHMFELGLVYLPKSGEGLPEERMKLAGVMMGQDSQASLHGSSRDVDYFDVKFVLEKLFSKLHLQAEFDEFSVAPFCPGKTASITFNGNQVGAVGVIHPMVCEEFSLANKTVLGFELDFENIFNAYEPGFAVELLQRFPSIEMDISFLVDKSVTAKKFQTVAKEAGGEWLKHVTILDHYESEKLGENKKSLMLRLEFNAGTRTLLTTEAEQTRDAIATTIVSTLGAVWRDK